MSLKINESLVAAEECITIAEYIARTTNVEMGRSFLRAVRSAYEMLADMPGIGVSREYRNPRLTGMRMWPISRFPKYLIFYIPSDTSLEIIRVLHGARDLENIFNPNEI